MSPRLPYYDQPEGLDPAGRRVYDQIRHSRDHVVGVFALLLNSPPLAKYTADLGGYLRFDSILPPRVKELVILTTLQENRCQFEWAAHEKFAENVGISRTLISQIKTRAPITTDAQPTHEDALLIQAIRELTASKRLSDATYQDLTGYFSAREITEITALAGYYCMVSCVLNAAQLAAPPGDPHLPEPAATSRSDTNTTLAP